MRKKLRAFLRGVETFGQRGREPLGQRHTVAVRLRFGGVEEIVRNHHGTVSSGHHRNLSFMVIPEFITKSHT
jgi:hypothetical protein